MQWLAQAPANIALIKYMGKKEAENNVPINPSLSYTLPHLLSTVQLEFVPGIKDYWEPLSIPGAPEFTLSAPAQTRFLAFLKRIKQELGFEGAFIVRSSNNFPQGSGLASSASSFAALTRCAVLAISELIDKPLLPVEAQAELSRLGSGSSCRSFFSPWALWDEKGVRAINTPYPKLLHQVIIISHEEKKVPSSLAHRLVETSPLFPTRAQRAKQRLGLVLAALEEEDWTNLYQLVWQEFQEMHKLFATCDQAFTYFTPASQQLLEILQDLWNEKGDGPLITMDAGPNIHLLYRLDQQDLAALFKQKYLVGNYDVL